jgi:hypothetical protein
VPPRQADPVRHRLRLHRRSRDHHSGLGLRRPDRRRGGVGAGVVWSAIGAYLIVKCLDATVGARVSLEEERNGVELAALGCDSASLNV